MNLKRRTTGGEGKTAKDALKALASALKNEEVDEDRVLVVEVVRGRVRALGDRPSYDGFLARVVSAPGNEDVASVATGGVGLIAVERRRQIFEEHYTPVKDARYLNNTLSRAAIAYATDQPVFFCARYGDGMSFTDPFPWDRAVDKRPRIGGELVFDQSPAARARALVKAGALIAAEIDNILYKQAKLGPRE